MQKRLRIVFVLLMVIFILGCQSTNNQPKSSAGQAAATPQQATATANQDPLDQLYQAAKKEGKVAWWGPTDAKDTLKVSEMFNKRFPGIKVEGFEITSGEAVPRIISEAKAKQYNVDIADGNYGTVNALLDRDLIAQYNDWETLFKIPKDGILKDGKMLAFFNLIHTIHYNTNLVSGNDIPKKWEDLLNPKWKGKILVEARGKPIAYLGADRGKEWMTDFAQKLKAQNPIIVKGQTINDQLAAGAGALAIGSYVYKNEDMKAKGAPVDWVILDPVGASQFGIYVLKNAPHPNAAKLLAGWLGSKEGIAAMGEITGGRGPVYKGAPTKISDKLFANNARIFYESDDNSKLLADLEASVTKILAGQK
jgi:iron(III) transport system substrate-binding protein